MCPYFKDQMLSSLYVKFMRKWFPKSYARQGWRRAEEAFLEQIKVSIPDKRSETKGQLSWELWEWTDLIREIEDAELVAKAAKMDIHLDDMPPPYSEDEERRSHYELGNFGNRLLNHETRVALRAKTQERGTAYRKERREAIELYIKILTALTGLGGVAIGLIAVLKK